MKQFLIIFFIIALLLTMAACGNGPDNSSLEGSRTIIDFNGREVTIPETVESIVCVGVGSLRYTCYMSTQDLVIGVEDYEKVIDLTRPYNYVNYELFMDLPIIGTNGEPHTESIIDVNPQVIVMSALAKVDADDLQIKTGIPVVVIPTSDDALDEGAYETIRIMGELYGKEDRAVELTNYLHMISNDLKNRTESVSEKPSVYVGGVAFQGWHGMNGTEAGYSPFLLIDANNLADTAGQDGAFEIDPEQILAWDPDVIFLDYTGMDLVKEDYSKNPDFYNSLTAFRLGKVYAQIPFRAYAANLDTALADAYWAASILYPEQFADIDIEEKVAEIFTMLLGGNPYDDMKEAGYEFRAIELGAE